MIAFHNWYIWEQGKQGQGNFSPGYLVKQLFSHSFRVNSLGFGSS